MKPPEWLLSVVLFFLTSLAFPASLPLPPPVLPAGWQRVAIPEVGTIDIPPTMEVQSVGYLQTTRQWARSQRKDLAKVLADLPPGRFVIQQKGLNEFDPVSAKSYVRIIVSTHLSTAGDFECLGSSLSATPEEMREIARLFRSDIAGQSTGAGTLLELDMPSLETVNGMQAIRLGYRRQCQDYPPARTVVYRFQNYDREHYLTMSYRETERDRWLPDFPSILSSFRITNIAGEMAGSVAQSHGANVAKQEHSGTEDQAFCALAHGEWGGFLVVFLVSAIATWGIGLTPPLLTRFAIMRKPMSKDYAIIFVGVFLVLNIGIFTALGGEGTPGSHGNSHTALVLVMFVSYAILRRGAKRKDASASSPTPQHGTEGQLPSPT